MLAVNGSPLRAPVLSNKTLPTLPSDAVRAEGHNRPSMSGWVHPFPLLADETDTEDSQERLGFLRMPTFDELSMFAPAELPRVPTGYDLYGASLKLWTANGQGVISYASSYSGTLMNTWNPFLAHFAGLSTAIGAHTAYLR